jgi:hypothetical protein
MSDWLVELDIMDEVSFLLNDSFEPVWVLFDEHEASLDADLDLLKPEPLKAFSKSLAFLFNMILSFRKLSSFLEVLP